MRKHLMMSIATALIVATGLCFASCGSGDDDDNNTGITEYVGMWNCTSPATYRASTIVTEGTTLQIATSGDMKWVLPEGGTYNATMRTLGDDWADITYNCKIYKAEIYVRSNSLTINVNGDANLTVKDFPFDGTYIKVN